jgi:inositol hexakisphosphate/diphosphoinositol-pentakisphosphate kinase
VFKNRFIHGDAAAQKKFMRGLKVFTTDESRVRYTACSFVRSLLDLDKEEKIPDGVLQSGPEVQYMLDDVSRAKARIEDSKSHIAKIINSNNVDSWMEESDENETPSNLFDVIRSDESEEVGKYPNLKKPKTLLPWAQRSLKVLHDPRVCCMRFWEQIRELIAALKNQMELSKNQTKTSKAQEDIHNRYNQESFKDMVKRWSNLLDAFYDEEEKGDFDATKIPNLFDSVRYELLHNANCLGLSYDKMDQLWERIEALTGFVTPQEYGVTREDKLYISRMIAKPFFSHLAKQLQNTFSNEETTRCFLYFSSESHLHALRNALIICKTSYNQIVAKNVEGMDLSYFSHGVIRIFEDLTKDVNHPKRFYSTIHFSPGAHGNPLTQANLQVGQALIPIENPGCLNGRFPIKKLLRFLQFA